MTSKLLPGDEHDDRNVAAALIGTHAIREALTKWSSGDFEGALADLDNVPLGQHTSESILLRARALLRLHRDRDAEKWLLMMESYHRTADAIATHAMLLGTAYSRLDNFESASAMFSRAREVDPHETIVAETAYYHALTLWQARKYGAARTVLLPAIEANQDIITARSLQLLGFIAIGERKFLEAHRHFDAALESLSVCRAHDLHLEATLLVNLSIGRAEIEIVDPTRFDVAVHQFPWTDALVAEHVECLRHIGLAYARTEQLVLAIERFIEASQIQPGSAWEIIALQEVVTVCHRGNEPTAAAAFLAICQNTAERIAWDPITGPPRIALLHLAITTARLGDGARARTYLDWYYGDDAKGAQLPSLWATNFAELLRTVEKHADGIVSGACGEARAQTILREVIADWRRLRYYYRADEAAADLRTLTHRSYRVPTLNSFQVESELDDETCDAYVQARRDRNLPVQLGIFVGEERRVKSITVTAQQDRIIRQVILGKTIADIAAELSLEAKTIRNHLAKLYDAFEVAGQPQLIVAIYRDPFLRRCFCLPSTNK